MEHSLASVLRRAHVTGCPLDDIVTSALAHLLVEYGARPVRTVVGTLSGHNHFDWEVEYDEEGYLQQRIPRPDVPPSPHSGL